MVPQFPGVGRGGNWRLRRQVEEQEFSRESGHGYL
jgi:hypothetical protein